MRAHLKYIPPLAVCAVPPRPFSKSTAGDASSLSSINSDGCGIWSLEESSISGVGTGGIFLCITDAPLLLYIDDFSASLFIVCGLCYSQICVYAWKNMIGLKVHVCTLVKADCE